MFLNNKVMINKNQIRLSLQKSNQVYYFNYTNNTQTKILLFREKIRFRNELKVETEKNKKT